MSSRYMRKRFLWIVIIFVVLFQVIWINFLYVEAADNSSKQREVCNWPSETMQDYFNFQKEMKSAMLWSALNEKLYNTSTTEWLFTKWTLKLPSALDFVASNIVWSAKSTVSVAGTSVVLLILAAASVFQANTEWFTVLFRDRPIVRDYRTMLDIETELFDVAFFVSKQMNLTHQFQTKEIYDKLNTVIEKYQWKWLFVLWDNGKLQWTESIANVLEELLKMNAAMKHFILNPWIIWEAALNRYDWCFRNLSSNVCENWLKFDPKAIEKLKSDYAWLWTFGDCNVSWADFKNSISKSIENNKASVKSAVNDVKVAINRLNSALLWASSKWDESKSKKSRCDLSEYELAQLRAYWWPDWECGKFVEASVHISKANEYIKNKKSQNDQREKDKTLIKYAANKLLEKTASGAEKIKLFESMNGEVYLEKMKNASSERDREQMWYKMYLDNQYNSEFLYDLAWNMMLDYEQIMWDYPQTQRDASSSDFSHELKKIRWLLDQVDEVSKAAVELESQLKKIAKYQCES